MKTARYVSKLVDDRERQYETEYAVKDLLKPKNLMLVNGHVVQGSGAYDDLFLDDMAFAHTIVTMSFDSAGRSFPNVDIAVAKFDGHDRELILELLKKEYHWQLTRAQLNGGKLENPLPEIMLDVEGENE